MTEERLISLITRQMSGELDPKGTEELQAWAGENIANQALLARISNEADWEKELERYRAIDPWLGYTRWLNELRIRRRSRIIQIAGFALAASFVGVIAIDGWLRVAPIDRQTVPPTTVQTNMPVPPGRNTAILTLSSGRQILLDSAGPDDLASENNVRLVKPDNGSLEYQQVEARAKLTDVLYNLLSTPRSGQYQLVLADGSRVWLNNVSSLRFPTTFTGKERVVELSGEAYFEVAKDAARPFIVKIGKESVEVLGTSFNIMAYPEEGGTQTTLVNGAVRVKTSGNTVELQRDEQARVNANGGLTVLRHVNAEDIASWRNGFFYFGRASFEAIMRQLARWYNIEVVYEGKVPQMEFGGKIDRELSLDELLKYLDKNQLHFRLEGRRLVVLSR